jgi:hypothetical protein
MDAVFQVGPARSLTSGKAFVKGVKDSLSTVYKHRRRIASMRLWYPSAQPDAGE